MSSGFGNSAVLHNKNLIGIFDCCQTVGNCNNRLTARQLGNCLLNQMLVFGVNACGRFIKYDDRRIFKNCTGNRNTLFLTARKRTAALADNRVVALRHRHDKIVTSCFFRRRNHFFLGCVRLSEADICANRIIEEVNVLEHH